MGKKAAETLNRLTRNIEQRLPAGGETGSGRQETRMGRRSAMVNFYIF